MHSVVVVVAVTDVVNGHTKCRYQVGLNSGTSQWNPRLDHAKLDRRRRRLENENVDEKNMSCEKSRKSSSSAARKEVKGTGGERKEV